MLNGIKKKRGGGTAKMDKVVTINDIAKAAGVGKGTVDRVLHNRGRVSEETKEKVQKCIKEMGYKPNKAARMLAKTRRYRIAVVYHNKEEEFWKQIECGIDKAEEEYKQLGVTIKRFVLSQINVEEQEKLILQIIEEKYDGLAIVPYYSEKTVEAINKAVSSGITVVTFNNDEKCNRLCYVGQDLLQSGKTAGKLMSMIAKPHSRYIVVLPVIESMTALYGRYEGFKEIIEKKKLDDKIMKMINYFIDNTYSCIDTLEYCWQIIMHLNTKKYKITEFKKIQLMEIISKAVVNMYNNIESWVLFNLTIQRIINILNESE